jgi:dTMP kinase
VFVTFEGIDACGKSTQYNLFVNMLKEKKIPFISVREPGGTKAGEDIRKILLHNDYYLSYKTEVLLFVASRAQITKNVIEPALNNGMMVVADRFMDSSVAYQGYGRELGSDAVKFLNNFAVENCKPDITYFIDITVDEAFRRMKLSKKNDKIELESKDFFQRVRNGYFELLREEKKRFIYIDGMKNANEVFDQIKEVFFRKYV